MFKFNFDIADCDEYPNSDPLDAPVSTTPDSHSAPSGPASLNKPEANCVEHDLTSLLHTLPSVISFSPLVIPLPSGNTSDVVKLARRDLFDARFQLISQDDVNKGCTSRGTELSAAEKDLEFIDTPSDLVPGVYEGGLKTWDCALDLVDHLHDAFGDATEWCLEGKHILELGCGTAVPSLYIVHRLFSGSPPSIDADEILVHLQDFNTLVLQLVTLPNIILAWYMSPASLPFRATPTTEELPPAEPTEPGTLPLTPSLILAFLESLKTYHLQLKFFSGSWECFDVGATRGGYDIILTSETIYRLDSLPALIRVMRQACLECHPPSHLDFGEETSGTHDLEKSTSGLSLEPTSESGPPYVCLVAAKRVYFGVGGGVAEFVQAVDLAGGKVTMVWERLEGVKRVVMKIIWV
ncbi:uncharacterized protein FIBRA_07300 [Fibroporia radiculosa]|uniref:protein-histidine N-methyltransferase n=1 Tax=Fibroporia radiculosa TaxID=599839 RepID=J4GE21_9APHY|nr:uncharacterized protein FIBRA_07300 [Fibroporia radiculosa]CCM05093.1 predicted protein [Fibroporia radiculosa]